jgi:hypothetical protein
MPTIFPVKVMVPSGFKVNLEDESAFVANGVVNVEVEPKPSTNSPPRKSIRLPKVMAGEIVATGLPEVAVLAKLTKLLSSERVSSGVVVGFVTLP